MTKAEKRASGPSLVSSRAAAAVLWREYCRRHAARRIFWKREARLHETCEGREGSGLLTTEVRVVTRAGSKDPVIGAVRD